MIKRSDEYMVTDIIYETGAEVDRCAIISKMTFDWLQAFCPDLVRQFPLDPRSHETEDDYLHRVFNPSRIA